MVREPFLIQSKRGYRHDLHISVLTIFRQAILQLAGDTLKRTGHSSSGYVHIPRVSSSISFMFYINSKGATYGAPGTNIRLIMVCLGNILSWGYSLHDRSINTFNFRECDDELKSSPSSWPTDICRWLNRSTATIPPPPPPRFVRKATVDVLSDMRAALIFPTLRLKACKPSLYGL